MPQNKVINVHLLSPLHYCLGLTLPSDESVSAVIAILLFSRLPLYVSGFIASIIVNPTNRMLWRRALANISQEVFKISPFRAYCNSTTTIIREGPMIGVGASLDHGIPRSMNGTSHANTVSLAIVPMCPVAASTTQSVSIAKITGADGDSFAALASTQPQVGFARHFTDVANNGQPTKDHSFAVYKIRMRWFWLKLGGTILFRHIVSYTDDVFRLGDALTARLRAVFILA